jgi:hypothetical protein
MRKRKMEPPGNRTRADRWCEEMKRFRYTGKEVAMQHTLLTQHSFRQAKLENRASEYFK